MNQGILPGGERYVVYRIALYTDGFKRHKSLSDSSSVEGCYILSLGRRQELSKSASACRVITVAPPGHSPNEVLNLIENDLITGAKEGFGSIDPFGRPVRIFIDTVAMFGDYPALSGTADVRGHNATSFCTFCTFRERPNSSLGSKIYSSSVHSKRMSAMRNDERRMQIRPHLIDERISQRLGMKKC